MSRSLLLKITGGLSFAALLTALAIAVWPASNTDRARSDGEALATADDEFSQEIYEWELDDAVSDLNGNAEDFRTEGPEVQQAFWEGYQSAI